MPQQEDRKSVEKRAYDAVSLRLLQSLAPLPLPSPVPLLLLPRGVKQQQRPRCHQWLRLQSWCHSAQVQHGQSWQRAGRGARGPQGSERTRSCAQPRR
jgi:hypothetical protein